MNKAVVIFPRWKADEVHLIAKIWHWFSIRFYGKFFDVSYWDFIDLLLTISVIYLPLSSPVPFTTKVRIVPYFILASPHHLDCSFSSLRLIKPSSPLETITYEGKPY
jgi:hypothetical protein